MQGGTPQQFIDSLSYGMEQIFIYRGKTICVQGFVESDGLWTITMDQLEPESDNWNLWKHRAPSIDECVKAFLATPLFDGRTFWEAEGEIELIFA